MQSGSENAAGGARITRQLIRRPSHQAFGTDPATDQRVSNRANRARHGSSPRPCVRPARLARQISVCCHMSSVARVLRPAGPQRGTGSCRSVSLPSGRRLSSSRLRGHARADRRAATAPRQAMSPRNDVRRYSGSELDWSAVRCAAEARPAFAEHRIADWSPS